jgi:hypothetical protein
MKLRTTSLAIVTAALVAVSCSSDAEPAAEPATEPTEETETEAPAADGPTIEIEGFKFSALDPVAPGTEIVVANLDGYNTPSPQTTDRSTPASTVAPRLQSLRPTHPAHTPSSATSTRR